MSRPAVHGGRPAEPDGPVGAVSSGLAADVRFAPPAMCGRGHTTTRDFGPCAVTVRRGSVDPVRLVAVAGTAAGRAWERAMAYRIRGAELTACRTAVVRAKMHPDAVAGWIRGAHRRVAHGLRRQGRVPCGPAFARYTSIGELIEVEAGFPVADAIDDDGDVLASGLPGGPAVIVTHIGDLELLDTAYDEAESWLTQRGLEAAGPHWETYHTDPGADTAPDRRRTDLVIPYSWQPVCSLC